MTNELTVLQDKLAIAEYKNEILELKYKLQLKQAEKTTQLQDSLFSPALYDHYQKVAEMLAKTSVVPAAYKGKPGDIFVAMAMGYQLGFPVEQALQDIAVINGRPCLWGDGLIALVLSHPECLGINELPLLDSKGKVIGYSCTVMRKGHEPHTKQFTMEEAITAGLVAKDAVWKTYPTRMLQMRARSLALRDKFADAMRGLRITEIEKEDARIIEGEVIKENKVQNSNLKLVPPSPITEPTVITEEDLIRVEQISVINDLMKQLNFKDDRMNSALEYYGVTNVTELSYFQANRLIIQLQKLQQKEAANAS